MRESRKLVTKPAVPLPTGPAHPNVELLKVHALPPPLSLSLSLFLSLSLPLSLSLSHNPESMRQSMFYRGQLAARKLAFRHFIF